MRLGGLVTFGVLTSIWCFACGTSPVAPSPVAVAGRYVLSIIASPSCDQISIGKQLGPYKGSPIELTENGSAITGSVTAINPPSTMTANVSGQIRSLNVVSLALKFTFGASHIGGVNVTGAGVGVVSATGIAVTLSGHIAEAEQFSRYAAACDAPDHQFTLSRVG